MPAGCGRVDSLRSQDKLQRDMKKNLLDVIASSMGVALPIILGAYSVASLFIGQVSFKQSTLVEGFWRFAVWQLIGNLVSFTGVLAYTWFVKLTSLNLAYAVYGGLGFVAVQVAGAWLLFKERISPWQWVGTALICAGILLIALTRQASATR